MKNTYEIKRADRFRTGGKETKVNFFRRNQMTERGEKLKNFTSEKGGKFQWSRDDISKKRLK